MQRFDYDRMYGDVIDTPNGQVKRPLQPQQEERPPKVIPDCPIFHHPKKRAASIQLAGFADFPGASPSSLPSPPVRNELFMRACITLKPDTCRL